MSAIPRLGYLIRTLKPTVVAKAASEFDLQIIDTATAILRLPHHLTLGARKVLTLPIRHGGLGLRSMARTSHAAYWSGLAQAAPDILASAQRSSQPTSTSSSIPSPPPLPSSIKTPPTSLPLMQALAACHASFVSQGLPTASSQTRKALIPPTSTGFWDWYGPVRPDPGLQRSIVSFIEKRIFSAELISLDSDLQARTRRLCCSAKNAGIWMTTLPYTNELTISDGNYRLAARFWIGLPPLDDLPKQCHCQTHLSSDPDHFLSCPSFRRSPVTQRHTMLIQLLARLVFRAGGSAYIEPRWFEGKRPDLHVAFPDRQFQLDGSYIHSI